MFPEIYGQTGIASGIETRQLQMFLLLHDYPIFDDILCLRHMSAVVGIFVNGFEIFVKPTPVTGRQVERKKLERR